MYTQFKRLPEIRFLVHRCHIFDDTPQGKVYKEPFSEFIAWFVHKLNHCVILVLMLQDLSIGWCELSRALSNRVILSHSIDTTMEHVDTFYE